MELLPRGFYEADTLLVARALIGKIFVRRTVDGLMSARIVETEGYKQDDPACHAFRGKTKRNAAMFGPAGLTYVYFTYGVHYMLNVVTREAGCGEAVLLRAMEPIEGIDLMRKFAGVPVDHAANRLLSGPGKLAKSLAIDRDRCNEIDLTDAESPLSIWDPLDSMLVDEQIETSPRIGISQSVELPWRFFLRDSLAVSRPTPRRQAGHEGPHLPPKSDHP